MAKKVNYRELEMDVMERLYHERKATRKRAYISRRRKKEALCRDHRTKNHSKIFDSTSEQSVYTVC